MSTYRVQLRPPADDHPGTTFDDAAAVVPYLAALGVTHLYCSPWLQAAPGSAHGYDVVDHGRLNAELGGQDAFDRMVAACREAGLGLVLDVVPNHAAVSEPESQNPAWWDLLKHGPESAYARWFDVDWSGDGRVLVPVLGDQLGAVLPELKVEDDPELGPVVRYYEHVLPVAPGTEHLRDDVLALLDAQHYRLAHWRLAGEELDYRRFFDVTTLAGVRVEDPEVFDATHRLVVEHVRTGVLDGLRIDHPDGLADPEGYLRRLAEQTGGSWVVVEKILEAATGEELPPSWPCAGTTGYDLLNRVLGVLVDPAGEQPLTAVWTALTGDDRPFADVVEECKRLVLRDVLASEVARLVDLLRRWCAETPEHRDRTRRALTEALVELLVHVEVYRAYVPTDGTEPDDVARGHVEHARAEALRRLPRRAEEIELVASLALGGRVLTSGSEPARALAREFVTRFQQTCGPVMAKGVEDTAFYRYGRLVALNEVGGDPGRFRTAPAELHAAAAATAREWPLTMTTLSTHDTKRSEDVRARLVLLAQCPAEWADAVTRWRSATAPHRGVVDPATEYFVLQSLVGAWPLSADRAAAYAEKATREAKARTTWTDPDPAFDADLSAYVRAVLADDALRADLEAFVRGLDRHWWTTALAQKALQLTLPGVADTYQGSETWDLSLVDPDNRRPVDFPGLRALLERLDADGTAPAPGPDGAAKTWLVSRLLRLRRDLPDAFLSGGYAPVEAAGPAADHVLAYLRGEAVLVVVPRLTLTLERAGGWRGTTVPVPDGSWTDVLTGRSVPGGDAAVDDLLAGFPVAVLRRT